MPKNLTTNPRRAAARGPAAAADPGEPAAWQGALTLPELLEVRCALLPRLQVAQANARGARPGTPQGQRDRARVDGLAALLEKLVPDDGDLDALPAAAAG